MIAIAQEQEVRMTRNWLTRIMLAAALCSGAVTALHPMSAGASQIAGGSARADTMRLTGCVERADQVMGNGSNSSTLGTTVDSQTFVLIKALPAADGGQGRTANANARASEADGKSNGATVGKMFRLSSDTTKLNPHVGHEVEITGIVQAAAPGAAAVTSPDKSNPSAADAPVLRVDALRMISSTCPK
jgi:hypothetical protein